MWGGCWILWKSVLLRSSIGESLKQIKEILTHSPPTGGGAQIPGFCGMSTHSIEMKGRGETGMDVSVGRSPTPASEESETLERHIRDGTQETLHNPLYREETKGQRTLQRHWIGCGSGREPTALA